MLKDEKTSSKKAAFIMVFIMVFVKLLGFAKQFVLAYFYGSSNISDAFMTANDIPTQVFSFVAQAIATSFIPMYCTIKEDKSKEAADKYTSNMITVTGLLCVLVCIVMNIFSHQVVKIFANGFSVETNNICAHLIRVSSIGVLFLMLTRILSGYLQVHNKFVITTSLSIPMNIIEMLFIALSYRYNYTLLGIGMLLGMISEFLIAYIASRKEYRFNLFEPINFKSIKKTIMISLPVIIGVGVNQINKIVDKRLASSIQVGGVSILGYASIINTSVQDILVTSFITVLFAKVSMSVAKKSIDDVKSNVEETLLTLGYILIPTTIGVIVLSTPIIRTMFGYGAFNESAIVETGRVLIFYSLGMLFVSGRDLLIRVFYAFGNTTIPLITSSSAIVINVVLDILLSKTMGLGGLALATSISAFVCFVLTYLLLKVKIGRFISKNAIVELVKIILSTVIMGIVVIGYYLITPFEQPIYIILSSGAIGIAVYFLCSLVIKIQTFNSIYQAIRKKIAK